MINSNVRCKHYLFCDQTTVNLPSSTNLLSIQIHPLASSDVELDSMLHLLAVEPAVHQAHARESDSSI